MEQQALILIDGIHDALAHGCRAIGGNKKSWPKIVGHRLWPEKSPDDAARLLHNCLDENRAEKLSPEQVLWIIREARLVGCHDVMTFIAEESYYQQPIPIDPDDEEAELQLEAGALVDRMESVVDRLKKMNGIKSQLKAAP